MEYVIWGVAPDTSDEQVLYTKATTKAEADRVCKVLVVKHGCKALRVQTINMAKSDVLEQFKISVRM